MVLLEVISFLLILSSHFVTADDVLLSVALFDLPNKQGQNLTMDVKGCRNVPTEWNDRVSSLELFGRCLVLYKDQDCTGRMMRVSPENRLWLFDLTRVNFNDMITSISSCKLESPKLATGRFAIQSPWDKGVLTVRRLIGGYTMVKTIRWRQDYTQQWDIEKNDDNTFLLTPRQFEANPVTFKLDSKLAYPTERVNWVIESLHNKMYMLRKYPTNLCLTMRPKMETELKDCRKENKRQHWVFRRISGAGEDE